MDEIQKFIEMTKGAHPHLHAVKKSEMIRRSRLVKWVRTYSEYYEILMKDGNPDPKYMEGAAAILNRLCDEFGIDGEDMQP